MVVLWLVQEKKKKSCKRFLLSALPPVRTKINLMFTHSLYSYSH